MSIIITDVPDARFGVMCESYFEMFIKLVHQASEELICILLFSDIQLLVPHLKDLQQQHKLGVITCLAGLRSVRAILCCYGVIEQDTGEHTMCAARYLPEVLGDVVLQFALHQMSK